MRAERARAAASCAARPQRERPARSRITTSSTTPSSAGAVEQAVGDQARRDGERQRAYNRAVVVGKAVNASVLSVGDENRVQLRYGLPTGAADIGHAAECYGFDGKPGAGRAKRGEDP